MKILSIKDSIIKIQSESGHHINQMVTFDEKYRGMILKTNENFSYVLVDESSNISINSKYKVTNEILKVSFDNSLLSKVSDAFGNILFEEPDSFIGKQEKYPAKLVDSKAPMFYDREKLNAPLMTGIFSIDSLIPIGLGQRELIIGDRKTGKTSIALSAIVRNKASNLKTIYVSIGQKQNAINSAYSILKENKALDNVAIVVAQPEHKLSQYLAPYIAMAYAEGMQSKGEDVLVIFDDLSKHANMYREMSLNMDKSGGREAYPSDLFYAHSKLLERAGKFREDIGGGSITALPIIETVEGDFANLLATNVISITDGQIIMDSSLAKDGAYPAIDIGKSVSRTGSAVQSKVMKSVAREISAIYAQYIDASKYELISLETSDSVKNAISKGKALTNAFIQLGYEGRSPEEMLMLGRMIEWNIIGDQQVSLSELIAQSQKDKTGRIIIESFRKTGNINKKIATAYFKSIIGADNDFKAKRSEIERKEFFNA